MIEYLFLVLLWAVFYASHSALASLKVKRKVELTWKMDLKWYRLFYSIFSLVFISYLLLFSADLPYRQMFPTSPFGSYVGYMLATFGTIILVRSFKAISIGSFLGYRPKKQENETLQTEGMYRHTRHPLYGALLLLFLGYFFISPSLVVLLHTICLSIYLPIGIYFEEKNLITLFGAKYLRYQQEVPAFFPRFGTKKEA